MAEPMLIVDRLRKTFGALVATDDCSLSVAAGEIHAFIGPNGAGKTTLVAQISGDLRPDSGRLVFDGRDITAATPQQRVEQGLVRSFQIPSVFREWTAQQNVAMSVQAAQGHSFRFFRSSARDSSLSGPARELLERVGLEGRASVRVSDLSHGEVRQLEIAMSLALRPRLLLLDEPMAGMGRSDSRHMTDLLASLRGEVTMLLIEHDMDVVFSLSDRVTVLAQGVAIASGTPHEIQRDPMVQQIYLGRAA